jgi:hypothetical protein
MAKFHVWHGDIEEKGAVFVLEGSFDGATAAEALDAYAKTRGYDSLAALRQATDEPSKNYRAEERVTHAAEVKALAAKKLADAQAREAAAAKDTAAASAELAAL